MRLVLLLVASALVACEGRQQVAERPPLTVFAAASLARPLRALSDSFQRREGITALVELGGSLEQSRKLTDLGRMPDVLMLADDDVVAALIPTYIDWYVRFATTRIVIAHGPKSRYADSITAENWWRILSRADVRIGRADPDIAPAGRHAVALLQRAAGYYGQDHLSDTIMARSPLRFLRPNATELAALLEAGEVDYILEYESTARQYGFSFVALPSDLALAVLYGISVPRQAARTADAVRFVAYALSTEGKDILRNAQVDVLRVPIAIGRSVPPDISDVVRTIAAAPTTSR